MKCFKNITSSTNDYASWYMYTVTMFKSLIVIREYQAQGKGSL